MDLPFEFPSETQVILEDVARSRALTQEGRMRVIRETIAEGIDRINRSPDADAIWKLLDEQEQLAHRNIREFIARHAPRPPSAPGAGSPPPRA